MAKPCGTGKGRFSRTSSQTKRRWRISYSSCIRSCSAAVVHVPSTAGTRTWDVGLRGGCRRAGGTGVVCSMVTSRSFRKLQMSAFVFCVATEPLLQARLRSVSTSTRRSAHQLYMSTLCVVSETRLQVPLRSSRRLVSTGRCVRKRHVRWLYSR